MKQKLRLAAIIATLLAALLVLGCQQSPEAKGEPQLLTEEYDSGKPNSIYSEGEFIIANFRLDTPTPCYGMTASASKEGNKITFLADVHSTLKKGETCIQVIGSASSKLKYGPMPKGRYEVSWQADYTTSAWESEKAGPVAVFI